MILQWALKNVLSKKKNKKQIKIIKWKYSGSTGI